MRSTLRAFQAKGSCPLFPPRPQRPANVESLSNRFSGTRIARELSREAFAPIRTVMCFELLCRRPRSGLNRLRRRFDPLRGRVSWHVFAG